MKDADCFSGSLDVQNYLRRYQGDIDNLFMLDLRGYHDSDNFRDILSSASSKVDSDDYHLSPCSKHSSCHLKDTHRHYSLPRSEHCSESKDTNGYNMPPSQRSRRQSKGKDKHDPLSFSKIPCRANDTDSDNPSSALRSYQHSRGCDTFNPLPRPRNYHESKDIASYIPSPVSKSYHHSRDTKENNQSKDMCIYNPTTTHKNYAQQKDPDKYDPSPRLRSSDIFEDDMNYEATPISRDYYRERDADSDSYYPSPRDYLQAKDTDKHYQPSTSSRNLPLSRGTGNHQLVSTKEGHSTEDIDDYRPSEDLRYYLLSKSDSDSKPKGPWYDRQSKGSGNHNSSADFRRSHESECDNSPDGFRHYKLSSKSEDPENFGEDFFEDMSDRILPADVDTGLDPAKPVLSFEKYTSLYQNERKIRLKKLRLLACKAFVSKEKLAIAKICNSRGKDCNLKIEPRHDRPLAKSAGVGAVVHVLFDGVLAGTGAAGSKIQAKRNAFEAALRKIYMPYLRVYEGADKHRELQASIKQFSKASGQSQNAVMPMSKELLGATVWRRPSKKALDKMRRAAKRRMERLTTKPMSSTKKEWGGKKIP
ncbi:hypothetical protein PoB_000412500 [Plakobranchus ocellatus]|uniref:DRBM domain-containing protein n=1 Tax=Plakobranchus ocellatus TaxID=259542 RepID=A0AAV3Y4M1_9GAST|nr:hypothetical protein PoB_000412500 [Plakobranchus ocellatus]